MTSQAAAAANATARVTTESRRIIVLLPQGPACRIPNCCSSSPIGSVNSSGVPSFESEKSVRPAAFASLMASAVGAEADTRLLNPAIEAFCTIS